MRRAHHGSKLRNEPRKANGSKAMKTVFDNHMLAHVWAQRSQAYGKTSNGNFYFDAGTLYSYGSHFKVAKFVSTRGDTGQAVLFNNRRYSMSTGRHQSLARNAVRGLGLPVFTVDNPDPRTDKDHLANYLDLIASRDRSQALHEKARASHRKDWLRREAEAFQAAADSYAAAFIKGDPSKMVAKLAREDAKAAKERAKREAEREVARIATIAAIRPIATELADYWRAGADWSEVWAQAETKTRAIGCDVYFLRDVHASLPTMLRVNGDNIETSRGAEFPVDHAKRAFRLLAAIVAKGEGWEANGHSIPLGHFTVNRVLPNGTIIAGCHTVAWAEVEACAAVLGLTVAA